MPLFRLTLLYNNQSTILIWDVEVVEQQEEHQGDVKAMGAAQAEVVTG